MKELSMWVIVIMIIVASVWATCSVHEECDKRGGVLVKDYAGLPACVASPEKP